MHQSIKRVGNYIVDKISHEELRYKRLKDSFDALNYLISDEDINQMSVDYITYLPENNMLFDSTKKNFSLSQS